LTWDAQSWDDNPTDKMSVRHAPIGEQELDMSGIRLSPKHGVNPSLSQCFYCGGDKNEVVLPGLMRDKDGQDVAEPHRAVWTMDPCDTCKGHMAAGIIVIEVAESNPTETPTRVGGFAVVRDEAIRRLVNDPGLAASIIRKRVVFLPTAVWTMIGLPKGGA